MMMPSSEPDIFIYHRETKHHPDRYAKSPGRMDWENQPDPFRTYDGARRVDLPLHAPAVEEDGCRCLYERAGFPPQPLGAAAVGRFLELGLGLSAWKSAGGAAWALRMNPSSGNLHPTEAYLVTPDMPGIGAGLYHYHPHGHLLEERAAVPESLAAQLVHHLGKGAFLLGLSSISWREAWKYGERALRYCLLDAGHALAALRFAAGRLGWAVTPLSHLADSTVAALLGLDRTDFHPHESEEGELVVAVHPHDARPPRGLPDDLAAGLSALPLSGVPNRLSQKAVFWDRITEGQLATRKAEPGNPLPAETLSWPPIRKTACPLGAEALIRRRRSGQSYDPSGEISKERFLSLLDKALPRKDTPPFDVFDWGPFCHLLLFVHRVTGLDPGLYLLVRRPGDLEALRKACRPTFYWTPVDPEIPLFLLEKGDVRRLSQWVSCHQEIAGMGAFSLGMIARFAEVVRRHPFFYRPLFWEAGLIGQVLYLEAEAAGLRGTGIGCFFDDLVHEILGLEDDAFQSLYHFTIGKAVEDRRIATLPAYGHLAR